MFSWAQTLARCPCVREAHRSHAAITASVRVWAEGNSAQEQFLFNFPPPRHPFFFFFFSCYSGISNAFINVSFFCPQETSVSGTFASRSLANTVSGESFWHSASTTSFVTALPVLPARLLLPHPLWPPALHTFVKKGICPRSSCDSLYFWCLFLRAGHLLYVEGRA